MKNIMISGLGLAALVATGSVFAANVATDADSLTVTAQGELVEGVLLSDRLTDATNDAATGHEGGDDDDDDDHTDHDHDGGAADADSGDTGDDEKGCGCSSSATATSGALAVLLPLGLVGLRRRQG